MTSRILLTILTLSALLLTTACNGDPAPADNDTVTTTAAQTTLATAQTTTTETTTTTAVTTTTVTTQTTAPSVEQPSSLLFVTNPDSAQFTLLLPASWEGRYTVREDATSVSFYELSNHQDSVQGHLFTIRYMQEHPDEIGFPSYRLLGEYDGTYAVALFPTDVQFSPELMDAYMNLYNEVDAVLATFTYTA